MYSLERKPDQGCVDLSGPVRIRMLRHDAPEGVPSDLGSPLSRKVIEYFRNLVPAPGHEHLFARLKKLLDARPFIGDYARAGAGGLEYPGRRGKAVSCHRIPVYVQHGKAGRVEAVMVARIDVAEPLYVGETDVVPAAAAEKEFLPWFPPGCLEEKLTHARLPVRHAVAEKAEISPEPLDRRNRIVRLRVKGVVYRPALSRAEALVLVHDLRAAAVCEYEIVFMDKRPEAVFRVVFHPLECCRGVDVPERGELAGRAHVEYYLLKVLVKGSHAARLYDKVGSFGVYKRLIDTGLCGRIDLDLCPIRVVYVPVLLPVIGIGLIERYFVSKPAEILDDAAVIRSGPVPVGRNERRAEERYLKPLSHRQVPCLRSSLYISRGAHRPCLRRCDALSQSPFLALPTLPSWNRRS